MKMLARKSRALSLVPPAAQQVERPLPPPSLNEFFDGWLTSVGPTLERTVQMKPASAKAVLGKLPLTSTDITRVNRATVRESTDHRHWPPDVVYTFMRADVIKRR